MQSDENLNLHFLHNIIVLEFPYLVRLYVANYLFLSLNFNLESNPALQTPAQYGRLIFTDSSLCLCRKKALTFSKFNPPNTDTPLCVCTNGV